MHSTFPIAPRLRTETTSIRLGGAAYHPSEGKTAGEHVTIEGEPYICLHNVDALKPFFMSVVSNSDVWIFAGSNSPFTAGRSHPDNALFPYQTADKILQNPEGQGAMTVLLVRRDGGDWSLWEPWRSNGRLYRITRNLYKHATGSVLIFEEINLDLKLRLRWSLSASDEFGLVRECELKNLSTDAVTVKYLDGWNQLIPAGVGQELFARFSYLAAGYMRHERALNSVLGLYTLNSRISDRAEPAEALRVACAWSLGHADPTVLLCARQVDAFRRNQPLLSETEIRGDFGAYLIADQAKIDGDGEHRWITVADTGLEHAAVVALDRQIRQPEKLEEKLRESVAANVRGLRERIAASDGLQDTADRSASVHHFANVLFNCMRGGTFLDSYEVPGADFSSFLKSRNSHIHSRHKTCLDGLPEMVNFAELNDLVAQRNDPQLNRLAREYLPLTFSRRHGDPSRPWNRFVIRVKDEKGAVAFDYQGNWRDIFQNWESLSYSYPAAIERMIAVFLNASTADGYNPYRVTRGGIDWETLNPSDPWSHIGYWGDHQIVYLLRLLQACEKHFPGRLASSLAERHYAYTIVPYEVRNFDQITVDPGNSIRFNDALHKTLLKRASEIGNDGKLQRDDKGEVALVSLAEKLLVPVLVKLSNLVPEGGIWMNTQRPDWNDGNNALVGWGLSMVTVYQMRPYLEFIGKLFAANAAESYQVSAPVADFAEELSVILGDAARLSQMDAGQRYVLVAALGRAGEKHRAAIYGGKLGLTSNLSAQSIRDLIVRALDVIDASIRANRRDDGMYHSYNLLELRGREASIKRLQLMLEGQVAALSSRVLSPNDVIAALQAMSSSDLYRADQHSYMLYPDREIRPFLQRNTLPRDWSIRAPLLLDLVNAGHPALVAMDENGDAHFQADLTNHRDLNEALDRLAADPAHEPDVRRDRAAIAQLWEEVFEHSTYLGRSGTMFAFEGLGSIYWHMVAKLLLAVQENYLQAVRSGTTPLAVQALGEWYYDVRRGLGFTKTADIYGAFPSDPYSHSPAHLGAQQPGMTGQVKEEILTRWGELGVEIVDGALRFNPRLLRAEEFYEGAHTFHFVALNGRKTVWDLPPESLAFTCCQVPVSYQLAESAALVLVRPEGTTKFEGNTLRLEDSAQIFARTDSISRIIVHVPRENLFKL